MRPYISKQLCIGILSISLFLLLNACSTPIFRGSPLIEKITSDGQEITATEINTLIKNGANPNENYAGASALLYAMSNVEKNNRLPVVKALLANGADINFSGSLDQGRLALATYGDDSIYSSSLRKLYHPSTTISGPLVNHIIAYHYYKFNTAELKNWLSLLKKYKFNPNVVAPENRDTPLHIAVELSLQKDSLNQIIPFLVRSGANCRYKNVKGKSPWSIIQEKANPRLKQAFTKYCR